MNNISVDNFGIIQRVDSSIRQPEFVDLYHGFPDSKNHTCGHGRILCIRGTA